MSFGSNSGRPETVSRVVRLGCKRKGDWSESEVPKRKRTDEEKAGEVRPIGFKELESICNEHATENAILKLENKVERFEALLMCDEIRPDLMKLVIRAVHCLCSSNTLTAHVDKILRSHAMKKFIPGAVLSGFINQMPYADMGPGQSRNDLSFVITQLADIFLSLIQRFGETIALHVPLPQLSSSLNELKEKCILSEFGNLDNKLKQVKDLKDEIIRQANAKQNSQLEPPQNFRELSVIPQAEDLSLTNKPFVRANVTDGRYKDLEQYLDVQFRLLREDLIIPLRDGVRQLKKENDFIKAEKGYTKEAKDILVYHDVTVLHPVCNKKGMTYRIQFNPSHGRIKRLNWKKSKRLLFGALVCLCSDSTPYLFASIERRDAKWLCQGELEVRFEGLTTPFLNEIIRRKEKFVMFESPAYFEAYSHVLEALKEIKADDLPFQKHIVECCRNVAAPAYLLRKEKADDDKIALFNFTCLTSPQNYKLRAPEENGIQTAAYLRVVRFPQARDLQQQRRSGDMEISLDSIDMNVESEISSDSAMESQSWPDRESLGFNESQMRAFQLALTKKFAVIQGPPGTGKTYVGLKIAHALLHNASLWQEDDKRSPILMVSYTNHALDQFLEGLLPLTTGIVRVGGGCKTDKLKQFTLKTLRDKTRIERVTPLNIFRAKKLNQKDIKEIKRNYKKASSLIQLSKTSIISIAKLGRFIQQYHLEQISNEALEANTDHNKVLLDWLMIKRNTSATSSTEDYSSNTDFRKAFSTRGFNSDNEDECYEDEEMKTAICFAKDTENPDNLRRNLNGKDIMSGAEEENIRYLHSLTKRNRWRLYRRWLGQLERHCRKELEKWQPEYEEALRREEELQTEETYHILNKAQVIGITSTGAAKYRSIIQRVQPKIVLIEEAAEVLEAHIVTSLPKTCEHLILIGDHQQLRPNPTVYKLAKEYGLDVSLFERMTNVGIESERLSVQHRMRPEIAALMKHIYNDLQNHESVEAYENIKGMKKNMFFVNHSHLEQSCEDSHSYVNMLEATFLVALCRYLLQQGYRSEQITLLTTYTGQMFAMRDCMNDTQNEQVQRVRLTTVDNYQGEENDIILLSLVRGNKNEKVGFIKTVNRTCVALSRAKKGFYCIGNLSHLSKYSDIWNKIVADLKTSGSIGDALPLVCQIHHSEVAVEKASDFTGKVTNGGCQRPCEVRLECGHVCRKLCHPLDTDHEEYKCIEPCVKTVRGCSHICPRLCWEGCVSECQEIVERTLPCSHSVKTKCGKKLSSVECTAMCEKTLPICGHRCQALCGKPCTKKCTELVKKLDWPCGHIVTAACSATSTDCQVLCQTVLECGHHCSGRCGECRMGRVHKRCKYKCGRLLVCSHSCRHSCNQPCPPCSRKCENRCKHSKCDKMCGKPCVPCREPCSWTCRHFKCSKLCGEICDRPRCNKPCRKKLRCRHICRGLCGEECICAECEKNDNQPITEIFLGSEDEEGALFIQLPDCKHIFAVVDLDRYMDMPQDQTADGLLIQLKPCPRCKTQIRRSQRYGNVIKQQLQDIEKVKTKVPSDKDEKLLNSHHRLRQLMTSHDQDPCSMEDMKKLLRRIKRKGAGSLENQVTLMERFCNANEKLQGRLLGKELGKDDLDIRLQGYHIQAELNYLKKRFMSDLVSERELRDIDTEFTRLSLLLELCLLRHEIKSEGIQLDDSSLQLLTAVQSELSSGRRLEEVKLKELMQNLVTIRSDHVLTPLTPEEKREIVSAIGLKAGHWFKCPKGHPYCIGECGGAMEKATCPECKSVIGGQNHALVEGNELAPEMDDARYAAWSEQANMANYQGLDE